MFNAYHMQRNYPAEDRVTFSKNRRKGKRKEHDKEQKYKHPRSILPRIQCQYIVRDIFDPSSSSDEL
jgi:hypothetical protein